MADIMISQALKIKMDILEELQVPAKAVKHFGYWFLKLVFFFSFPSILAGKCGCECSVFELTDWQLG